MRFLFAAGYGPAGNFTGARERGCEAVEEEEEDPNLRM